MRHLIFILFILSSVKGFTQSQTPKEYSIDQKLTKCLKDSSTTSGMCNCAIQAKHEWDIELNKYYKLLLAKLPSEAKEKLKDSQRTWIEYRDKEFEFMSKYYYEVKQGTMFYILSDDSEMQFVRSRTVELIKYFEMLED